MRRKEGRSFWGYDLQRFFLQNPQTIERHSNSLNNHHTGPNKFYPVILSKSNLKRIHVQELPGQSDRSRRGITINPETASQPGPHPE